MGKAHSPGKDVDNKEEVKAKGEYKSLYFQPSDFKRELKIIGQIGEPGQKDKLSFVSLVRQIKGALQKGYKPQEVVDAVVRAINPGMRLRSYLEGLSDLTLPRLRPILRSHFQEKSASDLYRQLSTLVQEPQENPQSFLIRALDTRQKILFASQEVDTHLKYDLRLVQGMFLHAIDTGLQDEAIRIRLRPILEKPDVQDEDLIQQMNVVVSEESERKSKLGCTPRQRNPRVNEVHASQGEGGSIQQGATAKKLNSPGKESPREEEFMAVLQAVRSELTTLKESVERNLTNEERFTRPLPVNQNLQGYQGPRGCIDCQKEGKGQLCDHCHICGSSDHWARGCQMIAAGSQSFKQCLGCKAVRYCGRSCQERHWDSHKGLCQAIQQLEARNSSPVLRRDGYVFASHLTPRQRVVVARLVGKKCKLSCVPNGVPLEALSVYCVQELA